MIIDMHVHVFADALAPRVRTQLENTANVVACTDLTEAETRKRLSAWNIDLGYVMPIATKPSQQRKINDWAVSIQHGNLRSFGTVHPHAKDALVELDRIRHLGLAGVKLHPDYQNFQADDLSVMPIYEKAADLRLPILFHAGFDPVSPGRTHCPPAALVNILEAVPALRIIGAHLGGNMMYDEAFDKLVGRDIYLDISMAPRYARFEQFERIVEAHDPKRLLFASDCPWSCPLEEISWVEELPLSRSVKEDILWKNAATLLELDPAQLPNAGI